MASAEVRIRIRDIKPVRLFLWQLRALVDQMRVEANPAAPRLEALLERFVKGGDDEP